MKLMGFKKVDFELTNKIIDSKQAERYEKGIFDFQGTTIMLISLTTIAILNLACFLGGVYQVISRGNFNEMFGEMFITFLIVSSSYPLYEGMIMRVDLGKVPYWISISSVDLVASLSILSSPVDKSNNCGTSTTFNPTYDFYFTIFISIVDIFVDIFVDRFVDRYIYVDMLHDHCHLTRIFNPGTNPTPTCIDPNFFKNRVRVGLTPTRISEEDTRGYPTRVAPLNKNPPAPILPPISLFFAWPQLSPSLSSSRDRSPPLLLPLLLPSTDRDRDIESSKPLLCFLPCSILISLSSLSSPLPSAEQSPRTVATASSSSSSELRFFPFSIFPLSDFSLF
ncbi:hypothetical protein ACLOJK_012699 [Asimina triloba]